MWCQPKKKLDDGKIKALRDAGWTLKQIGEEMKCSPATVISHLKAMGYEKEDKDDQG